MRGGSTPANVSSTTGSTPPLAGAASANPGVARKDRPKATAIIEPAASEQAAGASGAIVSPATQPLNVHALQNVASQSWLSGGGSMTPVANFAGASADVRASEEAMRRRSAELDERRSREWVEYQRLYRQETSPHGKVFLDIAIGDAAPARIVIELFDATTPRTAENFRDLCLGHGGWTETGLKLDLADTRCSRVVPGLGALFGDMNGLSVAANGRFIPDENFALRHNARGIVSMVSAGPNTIGSHFIITFDRTPQLDFKYVPCGRVAEGMPVLDRLERVPLTPITNIPTVPVVVTLSGAFTGKKPHAVTPMFAAPSHQAAVLASRALSGGSNVGAVAGTSASGTGAPFGSAVIAGARESPVPRSDQDQPPSERGASSTPE